MKLDDTDLLYPIPVYLSRSAVRQFWTPAKLGDFRPEQRIEIEATLTAALLPKVEVSGKWERPKEEHTFTDGMAAKLVERIEGYVFDHLEVGNNGDFVAGEDRPFYFLTGALRRDEGNEDSDDFYQAAVFEESIDVAGIRVQLPMAMENVVGLILRGDKWIVNGSLTWYVLKCMKADGFEVEGLFSRVGSRAVRAVFSKAREAVVLMRKLVKALFHVARGAPMNTQKLFDTTRLNIAPTLSVG